MGSWLLILILQAQSAGTYQGGVDTDITLHDFPNRELCESAAKIVKKDVEQTFRTKVTHQCLSRISDEWK